MVDKILFFLAALGVFNAFLLGLYFMLVKKKRTFTDYVFGFLMFCLVVRVGVSCIHYFGRIPQGLIQSGLVAQLLLGPGIFYYTKSAIEVHSKPLISFLIHTMVLLISALIAWILFDFQVWNGKLRFIIHGILSLYLFAIFWSRWKEISLFFRMKSLDYNTHKALVVFFAFCTICLGFVISLYTTYILGPLIFSMALYATIIYFLLQPKKVFKSSPQKQIDPIKISQITERLTVLMEGENIYRNPDLKLEGLAKRLSVSKHLLSQLLNENLNKNFREYINEYRIAEACTLIRENSTFSMEAIGYEVGFNSRSTFFSTFKRLKGVTPAAYKEEI